MKLAVLDDYSGAVRSLDCFSRVREHDVTVFKEYIADVDELAAQLRDCTALVLMRERTRITRDLLERLPDLRLISQTGRGIAHIDLEACTRRRVVVAAADVSNPSAPAELTWALILASLRHIPFEVTRLKAGHWHSTLGIGLSGRVLGVFGLGRIGQRVAQVGSAFGMEVLVWGRQRSLDTARDAGYSVASSQREFFATADVATMHVSLNAQTCEIVSLDDLRAMKPLSLFVNTSRAELVASAALATALREGRPGYAAVDVYEKEPILNAEHPLLSLSNALCAPHLGVVEKATYELYFSIAFDQVNAYEAGKPINVLNPAALGGSFAQ